MGVWVPIIGWLRGVWVSGTVGDKGQYYSGKVYKLGKKQHPAAVSWVGRAG